MSSQSQSARSDSSNLGARSMDISSLTGRNPLCALSSAHSRHRSETRIHRRNQFIDMILRRIQHHAGADHVAI